VNRKVKNIQRQSGSEIARLAEALRVNRQQLAHMHALADELHSDIKRTERRVAAGKRNVGSPSRGKG
jgi:hypothetical protein